jgi:hypothetical protein
VLAVGGHLYTARIQAYDRRAARKDSATDAGESSGDITPLAPGSPIQVDRDGSVVLPLWVSDCPKPVESVESGTRFIRDCNPLAAPF